MAKAKVATKDHGTFWCVFGKAITAIKITDIKQTGILYPDTPLYRYHLDAAPKEIVLEKDQHNIKIGRKFFTLDEDEAKKKIK